MNRSIKWANLLTLSTGAMFLNRTLAIAGFLALVEFFVFRQVFQNHAIYNPEKMSVSPEIFHNMAVGISAVDRLNMQLIIVSAGAAAAMCLYRTVAGSRR